MFTSRRALYSVVVLPEPVGPVTMKMPFGRRTISWMPSSTSGDIPSWPMSSRTADWSSTRSTTLSPNWVGRVETRRSTGRPPMLILIRPSCGSRRSAMFRLASTFTRETIGTASCRGGGAISYSAPSMR